MDTDEHASDDGEGVHEEDVAEVIDVNDGEPSG